MNIVDQIIYDIELQGNEDLGRELLEIVKDEQKQNKQYQVVLHQVIKVDRKAYTVIINYLEKN